jgi:hypothetical protein
MRLPASEWGSELVGESIRFPFENYSSRDAPLTATGTNGTRSLGRDAKPRNDPNQAVVEPGASRAIFVNIGRGRNNRAHAHRNLATRCYCRSTPNRARTESLACSLT